MLQLDSQATRGVPVGDILHTPGLKAPARFEQNYKMSARQNRIINDEKKDESFMYITNHWIIEISVG